MKITIESDEGKTEVYEGVREFGLIGWGLHQKLTHFELQRLHTGKTPYQLIGKLTEAIERLRDYTVTS